MSSSSAAANSSLRPAWHRGNQSGKGFQPPPAVPERGRSNSFLAAAATGAETASTTAAAAQQQLLNLNSFAALNDDDLTEDEAVAAAAIMDKEKTVANNSRSEGLRSTTATAPATTTRSSGRSLADLAARVPEQAASTVSSRGGNPRFAAASMMLRSDSTASSSGGIGSSSALVETELNVVRFTRERLLSMRPQSSLAQQPPPALLQLLEQFPSTAAAIISDTIQEPVCWDNLDAEAIWATVPTAASRRSLVKQQSEGAGPGGGVGAPGLSTSAGSPNATSTMAMLDPAARRGAPGLTSRGAGARDSGGRWQRGVALPPPDQVKATAGAGKSSMSARDKDASSPNELWDDPVSSGGAAMDFSAFGDMPSTGDNNSTAITNSYANNHSGDVFDFDKMAEASRKLEQELRGTAALSRSRASSDATAASQDSSSDQHAAHLVKVDPKRPLATIGTTIRSGSGEDVNVFEDFGDEDEDPNPAAENGTTTRANDELSTSSSSPPTAPAGIKAADEDPSASSRLMAMIGVTRDTTAASAASLIGAPAAPANVIPGASIDPARSASSEVAKSSSPWGDVVTLPPAPNASTRDPLIPFNPWSSAAPTTTGPSTTILGGPSSAENATSSGTAASGLDIQAHLREAANRERQRLQQQREAEELRRRQQHQLQEQEAQQRRVAAEEQARQAALQQQQQQAGVQTQVELVLMERIATVLENSWGRADLLMILQTLHSEDSRVIPLLSNADALRALILRHPRRVNIRQDPNSGALVVILVMTNAQWQQQQQQEARLRAAQQEEMRHREEQQRRMEEEQRAAEAAARSVANSIVATSPWYYSDPQNNIQGPFRANEMRQWLEAGYFKGDLPISQQVSGPFIPLSAIFPNLSVAFVANDMNDSEEEKQAAFIKQQQLQAEEQQRLEAEQREVEERARREAEAARALQDAAKREHQMRMAREAAERAAAAEEAERREAENSGAASNGGNESSAQLKMMLGLSALAGGPNGKQQQDEMGAAAGADPGKSFEKRSSKSTPTKNASTAGREVKDVQHQPEPSQQSSSVYPTASAWGGSGGVTSSPPEATQQPSSVHSSAPAWGGVAAAAPVQRKSMSEIQKEEARLAAKREGSRGAGSGGGSGWANVAAARVAPTTAWSAGTAKPTPAAIMTNPNNTTAAIMQRPGRALRQQSASAIKSRSGPQQHVQQPRSNSITGGASVAEAFGANMSPALERWCKDQMQQLNGSDDLTLVSFCMTLNDPTEIRQYLTAYLGTTPQVSSFASEFINKRGLAKTQQEQWETTAASKKTRKKKAGVR